MLQAWRRDEFRRDWNARAVDMDRAGWLGVAFLGTLPCIFKLWLEEGKPELALLGATHVLAMLAMAAACSYPPSRQLYVRHREMVVSLVSLHCAFICRRISTNGGTNLFAHHGGSPLRLLGLLFVGDFFMYGVCYHLSARLSFVWTCVALPLAVLLPLLKEQSICHRVVATPGIQAPLQDLHAVLRMVHDFATLTPVARVPGAAASTSPLEQCFAINAWLLLTTGIALPLTALGALERNARRLFYQRQQQQQDWEQHGRAADHSTRSTHSAARAAWLADGEPPGMHEWLLRFWQALLQSSVAWMLASVAAAVWLHGGPQQR